MLKTTSAAIALFLIASLGFAEDSVHFSLEQPGEVSLGLYDGEGTKVRDLLAAEALGTGEHAVPFDGLDDRGEALPAGEYEWRLITHAGLVSEYVTSLGTSWRHMPWPAQHGGPSSLAVQGDRVWVSASPEGSPQTVNVALDGSDYYWAGNVFFGWGHPLDTAVAGDDLWVLCSHMLTHEPSLWRQNAMTGKLAPAGERTWRFVRPISTIGTVDGENGEALPLPYTPERGYGWEMPADHFLLDDEAERPETYRIDVPKGPVRLTLYISDREGAPAPGQAVNARVGKSRHLAGTLAAGKGPHRAAPLVIHAKGGEVRLTLKSTNDDWDIIGVRVEATPARVGAAGERLALLFPASGEVAWYDPETMTLSATADCGPGGEDLALREDGAAVVAGGKRLVRVAPTSGQPEVLTQALTDGQRVVIAASGESLVYDAGEAQQVKRFSSTGELLASYGREGGRRTGLYVATDFRAVSDLAALPDGGFAVTEAMSAPRRTALFDAQGGVLREWFGGQRFYTFGQPDPDNSSRFWMMSQWQWLMEVEIDYATGEWRPIATYYWRELLDDSMVNRFENAARFSILRRDVDGDGESERFIWSSTLRGSLLQVDEAAGLLRPFALMEQVPGDLVGPKLWKDPLPASELPPLYIGALAERGIDVDKTPIVRQQWKSYSWADANGDGRMQVPEIDLYKLDQNLQATTSALAIDDSFQIYGSWRYGGSGKAAWWSVAPKDFTEIGAPIWPWDALQFSDNTQPYHETRGLRVGPDGMIVTAAAGGGDGFKPQGQIYGAGHGPQWPGTMVDGAGVSAYRADGRLLWRSGYGSAHWEARNGRMHYPVSVAGFVGGLVGVSDYMLQPCELWTQDGLYVGGVLDARADDGLPQRVYEWWKTDREVAGDSFDRQALFQYDMAIGGSLWEHDGSLYYAGAGWNNMPLFRLHGADAIERKAGTLTIAEAAATADGEGSGLTAVAYPTKERTGTALAAWTAERIWIDGREALPEALRPADQPLHLTFSGHIEGRWSQPYVLALYGKGEVELVVAGETLYQGTLDGKAFTEPVALAPGERVPIQLTYTPSEEAVSLHLNWESHNQQIEHVPRAFLYPLAK